MTTKRHCWLLAILFLNTLPSQALEVPGFAPDKKITYKQLGEGELRLHVFVPPNHAPSDRRPAIVFFFGGGWSGGSPSQFYPHCKYLASRGMVAMSAEYRVKTRHGTSPRECVQDGKSAIRWIRQHADELGIDATRVAAGGGSAGGHVAAATGTVKGLNEKGEDLNISCRPDALVLFNPVFDNGPEGWGHARVKAYWRDISPMHNIHQKTPPTIVFLGTKDTLIPTTTAEEYKKRMTDQGRRCDLFFYKVIDALEPIDIVSCVVKAGAFGLLIGLIATYTGFRTERATEAVGISTTKTMVRCVLGILAVDLVLTQIFLMIGGQ